MVATRKLVIGISAALMMASFTATAARADDLDDGVSVLSSFSGYAFDLYRNIGAFYRNIGAF